MDNAQTRSRRRETRDQSPVESSADELAAGSDREETKRRRTSWSHQKNFTPQRASPNKRQYDESDSPGEVAGDADEYWHDSHSGSRRRSPSPIDRPTPIERSHEDRSPDESDALSEDRREREEHNHHSSRDDISNRSSTPVPPANATPPPAPKPESLNYKEKYVLKAHLRGVSTVQFSPDCSMIASGGSDAVIKVWETLTGKLIYTFEGHLAGISTLAWSPDGEWIASGSDDKTIRFWNVKTGRAHTKPFVGHHNYVYQIAFAPKGNILVSGSYDEAVFLWDVRRASVMRSLPAHSDPVAGIDVVHDGTLIVSCAHDGLVRVWDTHSGQCLRTLVHEDNPPATCVKFSPNGKYILAWTLDGCIRMWNYVESRVVKTFQGHANTKYSISGCFGLYGEPEMKYSPPLCFAVSGSEDGDILCWDIVSKNVLQRIKGHTEPVLCVHTGKLDGKRLMVSCGLDLTVRLWEEVFDEDHRIPGEETSSTPLVNGVSAISPGEDNEDKDMEDVEANAEAETPLDPSSANTPAQDVMMT
ncbi:hypothetical protein N7481_003181 [Penicillium waksmanii]|uniref:uncharacterized protein n=1 Tax=Penicillium waksmanii TaxID=69791 RepID=UPI00254737BB|nr:uncharacterized protein N7481_003181 [Penicillium waksmanii]KAJ5987971.1 hypothetical protein N7481_003181 [Penicillium waksmanii]